MGPSGPGLGSLQFWGFLLGENTYFIGFMLPTFWILCKLGGFCVPFGPRVGKFAFFDTILLKLTNLPSTSPALKVACPQRRGLNAAALNVACPQRPIGTETDEFLETFQGGSFAYISLYWDYAYVEVSQKSALFFPREQGRLKTFWNFSINSSVLAELPDQGAGT